MSSFCRIKLEDVETISDLALARGLEHVILPFEGDKYADWVTVQLTNNRSRRAFENLCAENDVTVDGTQVVHLMTDTVLSGVSPKRAIDEALTRGMKRAMSNGAKYYCKECDQPIPKYTGRYPCNCPECHGELSSYTEDAVYEQDPPTKKQKFTAIAFKGTVRVRTVLGTSTTVAGAIQIADRKEPNKFVNISVKGEYTSDGTYHGEGRGRVFAYRENGQWVWV